LCAVAVAVHTAATEHVQFTLVMAMWTGL